FDPTTTHTSPLASSRPPSPAIVVDSDADDDSDDERPAKKARATLYAPLPADDPAFMSVLDPSIKTTHFKKQWSEDLELAARNEAEEIFKERYLELHPRVTVPASPSASKPRPRPTQSRSRIAASDSEDDGPSPDDAPSPAPTPTNDRPWLKEFNKYMEGDDEFRTDEDGVVTETLLEWWAVRFDPSHVVSPCTDYVA
ncbi:hypothetical protein DFP72DRAFT_163139, partial [Ephemerocybe angulata]